MKKVLVLLAVFVFATATVLNAETLTNDSIVQLHKLNFGDAVIIQKIKASSCNFDTSVDGLKSLKDSGLSDDVVQAMLSATSPAPPASSAAPPSSTTPVAAVGNNGSLVGRVLDVFGAPLSGVQVKIENSRFSTTTDSKGNYSLGYIPGTVQVAYSKTGYYDGNLEIQISSAASYPVQDLIMYKDLPSEGILLVGHDNYIKPLASIQAKQVRAAKSFNDQLYGAGSESQYFVVGKPVIVPTSDSERKFIINLPKWDGTYDGLGGLESLILLRVQPGGVFLRQSTVGIGLTDSKFSGQEVNGGTISVVNSFRTWTGHLDPGTYVFVMKHDKTPQGSFISEPSFYFEIGNSSVEPGPANSNGQPSREPQTAFQKLVLSLPDAGRFNVYARQYPFAYDDVWSATTQVLNEQHEKILRSDKNDGAVITDVTRHGILGLSNYDRYCLLVEKVNDSSTKITIEMFRFYLHVGDPSQPDSLLPQDLNAVNPRTIAVLEKIEKRLQTGK